MISWLVDRPNRRPDSRILNPELGATPIKAGESNKQNRNANHVRGENKRMPADSKKDPSPWNEAYRDSFPSPPSFDFNVGSRVNAPNDALSNRPNATQNSNTLPTNPPFDSQPRLEYT
jgi:hypothetical protein